MIKKSKLKAWLQRDITQRDKLLLTLGSFKEPCQIREIRDRATELGFQIPSYWNPSNVLKRSKGLAIKLPKGWELSDLGIQHIQELGVLSNNPHATQVASGLRKALSKIAHEDTRAFVEEAVTCFEAKLYRSAVVMSWVGAVAILRDEVCSKFLKEFNTEAARIDGKWRNAKNADDLARMKEAHFLDRLVGISLVGKDVKQQLENCLKLRNSCGHPNSLKIGENTVSSHIETLLLNVFHRFDLRDSHN